MARAVSPPFQPNRPTAGRGRGARSNQTGRYEKEIREDFDDGWSDEPPEEHKTEIIFDRTRRIINYITSPYVPMDRSINPYRGCEHGCIYCFARPSHAYLGMSPGLDFETRILVKPEAAPLLRRELSSRHYNPHAIALGTNTDPYQPAERKLRIMRQILEVLAEFNHPVTILTKSDLITRDIDILAPMAEKGLARAMISATTMDPKLARTMEPRVPRPDKRFAAMKALAEAGIPTGTMQGPMIPGLSDHELEGLMEHAAEQGASYAAYTLLRLPLEVAPLFKEWLETFCPDRAPRVLNLMKAINGGKLYDVNWSRGDGPRHEINQLLARRFQKACRKLGFTTPPPMRIDRFRVPVKPNAQGDLFGEG